MMTELLQDFEDINKQLDSTGKTLLNIAIERGAVKCVEKLLHMEADPNQWDSCEQVTAMHSVAMAATNTEELLELLRSSGGDINSGVERIKDTTRERRINRMAMMTDICFES